MAGTVAHDKLSRATADPGIELREAEARDDADVRRFLRATPTAGDIALSFEREPNYFHGHGLAGAEEHTVVAREHGRLVGLGRCTIRTAWLDGSPNRVAYLTELRLAPDAKAKRQILKQGYAMMGEFARSAELCFTSIAADNVRARRLLEAGLPGFPRYENIADFSTLVVPVPRVEIAPPANVRVTPASAEHVPALLAFLNERGSNGMLSTYWTPDVLRDFARAGLRLSDMHVVLRDRTVVGCAALWDQRAFRQNVIRGYSPRVRIARPLMNIVSRWRRFPMLPAVGSIIPHAFVSPLALAPGEEDLLPCLITALGAAARRRNVRLLSLGSDARAPRIATVQEKFGGLIYRTRMYEVRWANGPRRHRASHGTLCVPDVALL